MDKAHVLAVFLLLAAAIYVWAIWPRPEARSKLPPIPPFRSTVNGYGRHDLFQGVTLDVFLSGCDANSFDRIDADADLSHYVIAVVTVVNWIGRPQFVTSFTTSSGDEIVKQWSPVRTKMLGEAAGLFILPDDVISGRTEVRG